MDLTDCRAKNHFLREVAGDKYWVKESLMPQSVSLLRITEGGGGGRGREGERRPASDGCQVTATVLSPQPRTTKQPKKLALRFILPL